MQSSSYIQTTAAENGLIACSMCYQAQSKADVYCENCGGKNHAHNPYALQNTVALLITSIVLYIPANLYPIMYTTYLAEETANTILGGVITLWSHGSYPIAAVIFIASVLVPVIKIMALGWLCYSVKTKRIRYFKNNQIMYRITEFIGRWSMVDVFVVTVLVALIQLGNLMNIKPGIATISFAGMVVATMLAAMSFDSRMIWEEYSAKHKTLGRK